MKYLSVFTISLCFLLLVINISCAEKSPSLKDPSFDWPAWYEKKVTNIISEESGLTLSIALNSLPFCEKLPENIISGLTDRLLDDGLDAEFRTEIESLVTCGNERLDYIFDRLLKAAYKDSDSEQNIEKQSITDSSSVPYTETIDFFNEP